MATVGKKMNKKIIANAVFLILLLGITLYYVFKGQDFKQILTYIHGTKKQYLVLAFFMSLIFVCSESVIIHYLLRKMQIHVLLRDCIRYSFIGFFVSYITPSASGGQPAQMYFMKKDGIDLSISTLILMVVTIAYKFVLLFVGGLALLFDKHFIRVSVAGTCPIIWIGIVLNIIVISVLLIVIFKQSLAQKTVAALFIKLGKHGLIKNYEKKVMKLLRGIKKYENGAVYLKTNKRLMFNVFIITMFQRIALFFITFLIYKAFGLSGYNAYQIVALQTIISLAVDNLPLPGGMGITEGLYNIFFANIFGQIYLIPSLVLSRGISFYVVLLIGGIITMISYMMKPRKQKE